MKIFIFSIIAVGAIALWFLFPFTKEVENPDGHHHQGHPHYHPTKIEHREMVKAAQSILQSFDESQKAKALIPFEDEERFNWYYVPIERKGLTLEEMNEGQKEKCKALLRAGLSEQGFQKATGILALEDILRQLEGRPEGDRHRNPEGYYLSIFGEPGPTGPWGWRFEGHHLSLNYSSIGNELVAVTPEFMGANPAIVPSGEHKGKQVLKEEEDQGRALIKAMDKAKQEKAIINTTAPRDIITENNRKAMLEKFEGIQVKEMNAEERKLLESLLNVYIGNMDEKTAAKQWQNLKDSGLENLYFAWAGGLEPGEGHYYRIHGETLLIEYDNTQNNNNHVHAVWRDLTNDFGLDALRDHYDNGHSHD